MHVFKGDFDVRSSWFELKDVGYLHYFGGLRQVFLLFFRVKLLDHVLSCRTRNSNLFTYYLVLSLYFLVDQYAVVDARYKSFIKVCKVEVPPSRILYTLRSVNHSLQSFNFLSFLFEFRKDILQCNLLRKNHLVKED